MNRQVKSFIELISKTIHVRGPIYEFGSRQMIGQDAFADLRPLFPGEEYVGCDYIAGPGVDVVLDLREIELPDNSVQTLICCEVVEHVSDPFKAVNEIKRVLTGNGLLILSAPMNVPIHGSPYDYWRFTPEGFKELLKDFDQVFVDYYGHEEFPRGIVAIASPKGGVDLAKFSEGYLSWCKEWQPQYPALGKTVAKFVRPFAPRMFYDSNFELWRRHSQLDQYSTLSNFLYLCIPPIVLSVYKRIKSAIGK